MMSSPSWPSKRARTDADTDATPAKVKRQSSPSPPPERSLVTCGTKCYAPLPDNCRVSCPDYRQNRFNWVARCVKELEVLNLISERKLLRDDGLIIDWKSHVPVWSDTLKPGTQDLASTIMLAHRSNAQWHSSQSPSKSLSPASEPTPSSTQLPFKRRLPRPPRLPLKRPNGSSQPVTTNSLPDSPHPSRSATPRFRDQLKPSGNHVSGSSDRTPAPSDASNKQVLAPAEPPNTGRDLLAIPCASFAGEEEMSEMTLSYLRRYVQTFEADRASLASAYAGNASFAYRVHKTAQNISGGASSILGASPQSFSSGTKRTRLDIITTLMTLPCLHSNAQTPSTADVEYDMFCLGAKLGMIVVCRVVISSKTVVHNFILRRKEVDVEDAVIEGVWPLTASAHQILVFQA